MNRFLHRRIIIFCMIFFGTHSHQCAPFTLMISPAGDKTHAGRTIGDSFERGLTLQCAQYLQTELEHRVENLSVVISNASEKEDVAQVANRMGVDLYVTLGMYYDEDDLTMHLYHFLYQPVTDLWPQKTHDAIAFIGYDEAYKKNVTVSKKIAHNLYTILSQQHQQQYRIQQPLGIPFKPLVGVQAVAVGIEMSCTSKESWRLYAEKLADACTCLLETMVVS